MIKKMFIPWLIDYLVDNKVVLAVFDQRESGSADGWDLCSATIGEHAGYRMLRMVHCEIINHLAEYYYCNFRLETIFKVITIFSLFPCRIKSDTSLFSNNSCPLGIIVTKRPWLVWSCDISPCTSRIPSVWNVCLWSEFSPLVASRAWEEHGWFTSVAKILVLQDNFSEWFRSVDRTAQ
jgi:hypothetical protein